MEAVELLELSEIHHGIAAVKSKEVMRWLSKHKIQLNICPNRWGLTSLLSSNLEQKEYLIFWRHMNECFTDEL